MWRLTGEFGIEGMWGGSHVPEFAGNTLYWLTDKEGDVIPMVKKDVIYDPTSNARITSNRGLINSGKWDLDLYNSEIATYSMDDGEKIVFEIHNINDLSQMITNTIPDDPDYASWRGKALIAVP